MNPGDAVWGGLILAGAVVFAVGWTALGVWYLRHILG